MDVIEELTEHQDLIDQTYVERRVDDWRRRLTGLFDDIESWLPPGWGRLRRLDVVMDEHVMRSVGIAKERLPSLVLQRGSFSVLLQPRGLWIMGANGRVDMVSPIVHAVMIDHAELFEAPQWTIAPFRDQLSQQSLTQETFVGTLP